MTGDRGRSTVFVGVQCPDCENARTYEIDGRDSVCTNCGAVLDTVDETRSERQERRRAERAERQLTVGELREKLADFDQDANVAVSASGAWNYVGELRDGTADDHPLVILEEGMLKHTATQKDENGNGTDDDGGSPTCEIGVFDSECGADATHEVDIPNSDESVYCCGKHLRIARRRLPAWMDSRSANNDRADGRFTPIDAWETEVFGSYDPAAVNCPECEYSIELRNIVRFEPSERDTFHADDCDTRLELGVRQTEDENS